MRKSHQKAKEDDEWMDIFYLFFGITREIIWGISPDLKKFMINE